jgi:hypothetical protein
MIPVRTELPAAPPARSASPARPERRARGERRGERRARRGRTVTGILVTVAVAAAVGGWAARSSPGKVGVTTNSSLGTDSARAGSAAPAAAPATPVTTPADRARPSAPAASAAAPATTVPTVPANAVRLSRFCNGADAVDDTACLQRWVDTVRVGSRGRVLYAEPGRYLFSDVVKISSGTHIRCAGPAATVFERRGEGSGPFIAGDFESIPVVRDITVEECGFDVHGDPNPFAWVIVTKPSRLSENITVRSNRILDSTIRGRSSPEQRQYIGLASCRRCLIEDNWLSEGGRIKVGRPGQQITIRGNRLDDVNDNAITVVDIGPGPESLAVFDGTTSDIVVDRNIVRRALGSGVFFGVDGEKQDDPRLATLRVTVSSNVIEGDQQHCVMGILPLRAADIRVVGNRCVKTGQRDPFATGLTIKRANGASAPAQDVRIDGNRVVEGPGGGLDTGIGVSGAVSGLSVARNTTVGIGIRIRDEVEAGRVVGNRICASGAVRFDAAFSGTDSGNRVTNAPCR